MVNSNTKHRKKLSITPEKKTRLNQSFIKVDSTRIVCSLKFVLGQGLQPGQSVGSYGEVVDKTGKPILGRYGELVAVDGSPILGPKGELIGFDRKPICGMMGELLGPARNVSKRISILDSLNFK